MVKVRSLEELRSLGVDHIIDVRSPSEFAEDHIPGALNLPVLDDAERAEVGTMYKQVSPFRARKIGAAKVFRNASRHIETTLADKEGGWKPLVYCWRGGQRSGSFAWMLREIGWRADVIDGGYRTFRRLVAGALYERPLGLRVIKLAGFTGTAKTELLPLVAGHGVQVIDLEGLAKHRGSLLGGLDDPQPSQKAFETRLAFELAACDPAKPLLVEAESSTIGRITLPPSLWAAMKSAPVLELDVPLTARALYLSQAYAGILADADALREKLSPLKRVRGQALLDEWDRLARAKDHVALCQSLAEHHYDPAYRRSRKGHAETHVERIPVADLGPRSLTEAAERIAEYACRLHSRVPMTEAVTPDSAS